MPALFTRLALLMLATALPACALAANGFYLIGYGAESMLMGGADVAVARDAFAANNNPAGMTQLSGQNLEGQLAPYDNLQSSHSDAYGNHRERVKNIFGAYANAAYARRLENSPFAVGIAGVVQGGIGWIYSGLQTQFGTRDDASALFMVIKLAPALAWEVNEQLSLGATLGINYLAGNQELFPNTAANPSPALPQGFNGIRFKDASGIGLNSKWGLQYRPAKDVTIGLTYGTQTSIPIKNGSLRINLSNAGLGEVRYDNAKLTGMRLPEELALGVAFRPTPPLLISLQEKWYNWSDAINTLQLTASNPRTPGAPATITIPSNADFSDQHVIEIGMAYDYDKDTVLMAGVNHGSRPVPERNMSPIFAVIQARHYTLGFVRAIDKEWKAAAGVEIYPMQSVTYDSPIFGAGANERHNAVVLHLAASRRW